MSRQQRDKIANLVSRGEIAVVDSTGKMQRVQGSILAGENKDRMEHFEPFGFTSNPHPGAEFIPIFLEGDRSSGIALVCADRRYRIRGLPSGGIALGVDGCSIIINPDGTMAIQADTLSIQSTTISIQSDTITSQGEWTHTGEFKADNISVSHHTHNETGTVTEEPNA